MVAFHHLGRGESLLPFGRVVLGLLGAVVVAVALDAAGQPEDKVAVLVDLAVLGLVVRVQEALGDDGHLGEDGGVPLHNVFLVARKSVY